MPKDKELAQIGQQLSDIAQVVGQLNSILPGLTQLAHASGNLDRLGPRLDLIDQIGPRLEVIDRIGPHLHTLDLLGVLIEPLRSLTARIGVLDQLGELLRRFADENHVVSEAVRVDVETISALAVQVELFNRQLLEQLQEALKRE